MIIYPLPAQELDDATLSKQIRNIARVLCGVHYSLKFGNGSISEILKIPLKNIWLNKTTKYDDWAKECRANYLKLIEMGIEACNEWIFRFSDEEFASVEEVKNIHKAYLHIYNSHKLQPVIEWAKLNIPELPIIPEDCHIESCRLEKNNIILGATPFPLVLPDKYILTVDLDPKYRVYSEIYRSQIIDSYRYYYKSKLKKKFDDVISIGSNPEIARNRKMQVCGVIFTRREVPSYIKELLGV